jgi:very-short-patch-repair endonuclease
LRNAQLGGHKFRRQLPIGPYIVDFVCYDQRLVIEVDGGQHADNARDRSRENDLEKLGFRVLRFWNNDVLTNTEAVLDKILTAIQSSSYPSPTFAGRSLLTVASAHQCFGGRRPAR